MRKLPLVAALAATVFVAMVLPAGAQPKNTAPLEASCEDGYGDVTFDIILAEGSNVGFLDGKPVVFHEVDGAFVVTVSVNDDEFAAARFVDDSVVGKGKGLKLTHCEANPDFPIETFIFTIGVDATDDDVLAFLAELGIPGDPGLEDGDVVTFVSTFEGREGGVGTVEVQFPGR